MFTQKRINEKDLAFFFRELSHLLATGIPLATSVELITQLQHKTICKTMYAEIHQTLNQGHSLSTYFKNSCHDFSDIVIQLTQVSEYSGQLDKGLERIAYYLENRHALKQSFQRALIYPCILLGFGSMSTLWILMHIIPQFAELFKSSQTELPFISQALFKLSEFLVQQADVALAGCLLLCLFIGALIKQGKLKSSLLHQLPLLHQLHQQHLLIQFSRSLYLCLQAGVHIRQALQLACPASYEFQQDIRYCLEQIERGHSIHHSMHNGRSFSKVFLHMLQLGEESGSVDHLLERFTHITERKLSNQLQQLSQLIEPLIILGLGVLIGGLVISIYLPIFKLGSTL